MKHLIVSSLCILSMSNSFAFFFGGGSNGCSCSSGCPSYTPCPAQPICYPTYANCGIPAAYPPPYNSNFVQDCCTTCPQPCRTKHIKQIFSQKRQKRETDEEVEEELNTTEDATHFPTETESNPDIDSKCNSERLRKIIVMSKGRDITIIKRNIQLIAETQFNSKYNIICSADGDFSYITNTDEHCQEVVNGNTCYLFKQAKRRLVIR